MIKLKSQKQIEKMREAGKLLASCHQALRKLVKPGITTLELDQFVESFLLERGAKPAQKGYMGYPFATCASVNHEVCHGLPNKNVLKNGDIITIDFVVNLNGWLADSAWSYGVGTISQESQRLMDATKKPCIKELNKRKSAIDWGI